jgi:hypothetical protein
MFTKCICHADKNNFSLSALLFRSHEWVFAYVISFITRIKEQVNSSVIFEVICCLLTVYFTNTWQCHWRVMQQNDDKCTNTCTCKQRTCTIESFPNDARQRFFVWHDNAIHYFVINSTIFVVYLALFLKCSNCLIFILKKRIHYVVD